MSGILTKTELPRRREKKKKKLCVCVCVCVCVCACVYNQWFLNQEAFGFHADVVEDSILLGYKFVSLGISSQFPAFQMNIGT